MLKMHIESIKFKEIMTDLIKVNIIKKAMRQLAAIPFFVLEIGNYSYLGSVLHAKSTS